MQKSSVFLSHIMYSNENESTDTVLEMKIWIYWSTSNSWIYFI